jgi:hypothetical protein
MRDKLQATVKCSNGSAKRIRFRFISLILIFSFGFINRYVASSICLGSVSIFYVQEELENSTKLLYLKVYRPKLFYNI